MKNSLETRSICASGGGMLKQLLCASLLGLVTLNVNAGGVAAQETANSAQAIQTRQPGVEIPGLESTLDRLKEEHTNFLNSAHATYALTEVGAEAEVPEGSIVVKIGDKEYYYTPAAEDAGLLRTLSATGRTALEKTTSENALFTINGEYYTYNAERLPEASYTLTETSVEDPSSLPANVITLYEKRVVTKYYDPETGEEVAEGDLKPDVDYKVVETIATTPKYYELQLKETVFGSADGKVPLYYKWEETDGSYKLVAGTTDDHDLTYYMATDYGEAEASGKTAVYYKWQDDGSGGRTLVSGSSGDHDIVYWKDPAKNYDRVTTDQSGADIDHGFAGLTSSSSGGAIYNWNSTIGDIIGDFIGNSATGSYSDGGAIYNSSNSTIGNIIGDFIGNSATGSYSDGGAIYNDSSSTIGDITGDFIGNKSGRSGGAIYNYYNSTIGDITGDFIGNKSGRSGGAIHNEGTIGDITGDFIGNTSGSSGGAIYNYEGIGNITGDFIGNTAENSGGAIYNYYNSTIGDITGDFIGNTAENYGGAIYNAYNSTIGDITGDFIGNKSGRSGGAIYNYSSSTIGDITGDFIGNASSGDGGAIYNAGGDITSITGDFIGNTSSLVGGAIYNDDDITSITGDFIGNSGNYGGAIYNVGNIESIRGDFIGNSGTYGGAIYNVGNIESIRGDFIGNYTSNDIYAVGGAVANERVISDTNLDNTIVLAEYVIKNSETGESITVYVDMDGNSIKQALDEGYKIYRNLRYLEQSVTDAEYQQFISQMDDVLASGEAISAEDFNNLSEDSFAQYGGGLVNASFINNTAESKNSQAIGGAIFNSCILSVTADNGESIFSGNKTISGDVVEQNAIANYGYYVSDMSLIDPSYSGSGFLDIASGGQPTLQNPAALTLNAVNNGTILFNDTIRGGGIDYIKVQDGILELIETPETAYKLEIKGDSTGRVIFNNDVINANISISDTNVYVKDSENIAKSPRLDVKSGILNIEHFGSTPINFTEFANTGTINLSSVDVDLANETMGRISAEEYGETTGTINVHGLNLLSSTDKESLSLQFADKELAGSVKYTGASSIAYSPIYKYGVQYDEQTDGGYFLFTRGGSNSGNPSDSFNPAVLNTPVSNLAAGQATINETFKYVFEHADAFTQLPAVERMAQIKNDYYALSTDYNTNLDGLGGLNGGLAPEFHNDGAWVRPYVTFESMNLKNGPDVDAITYGTLIGFDSDFEDFGHGWTGVTTGYVGYNGSQLSYSGNDTSMNGGLLGLTQTFYKGDFWTAITASAGASVGETSTMYGSEDFTSLLAGIGSKTGYNFEFKEGKYILQPIMFLSYTFVNTFDYTNAAGVKIESDPLHTIQLNPSVRFIANLKNGWQPYASVGMVWNLLNQTDTTANGISLPDMHVKPYVEYGIGVQKRWADKFTAFFQTMIRNGGRNGVALTGGFRWSLGKDPDTTVNNVNKVKKVIKTLDTKVAGK